MALVRVAVLCGATYRSRDAVSPRCAPPRAGTLPTSVCPSTVRRESYQARPSAPMRANAAGIAEHFRQTAGECGGVARFDDAAGLAVLHIFW